MSDIIFPAGLIIDFADLDLEEMQHYAKMWNVEHTQMGKGLFEGSLMGAHTPRIQIGISHFSQAIMAQGSFPDGCIILFYASNGLENESVYNFQNRIILPHEIVILTKSDEIDLLSYHDTDVRTIAIEVDLFYKEFYTFFGDTPDTSIQNKRFHLKADKIAAFHQTIVSWIVYLANEFPKLATKPEYDTIEPEILRQLFDCMVSAPLVKKRKKFQIGRVRDMLHENIDKPISISTIINKLNICESQLHHAFKKEYSVTPKQYLRSLRFNAVKKKLLSSNPNSITIANIVKKYNFSQMGHFSAEYKKIFGETPSQTLRHNNSH